VLLPVNTLQLKRYPGIYSHAAKENRVVAHAERMM